MSKKMFESELAALLECSVEDLSEPMSLAGSMLWDSLAVVSTLALVKQYFNVSVEGEALENCQSLGDIYRSIASHQQVEGA